MTFSESLEVAQTVILLVGFGVLIYWFRQWISALRGALEAQRVTIEAQKVFIDNMSTLLNVTDAPKMLERYEAYKKMVDYEKEAMLQEHQETELAEDGLIGIVTDLLPYIPSEKRDDLIAPAKIPSRHKEMLARLAKAAPDFQAETRERARKALQEEIAELQKQKRLTEDEMRRQLRNLSMK